MPNALRVSSALTLPRSGADPFGGTGVAWRGDSVGPLAKPVHPALHSVRSAAPASMRPPNTGVKLRGARTRRAPHGDNATTLPADYHATPRLQRRLVSLNALFGGPARPTRAPAEALARRSFASPSRRTLRDGPAVVETMRRGRPEAIRVLPASAVPLRTCTACRVGG